MSLHFEEFFTVITTVVRTILNFLELVFVGTPWPVTTLLLLLVAWRVAGWKVTLFTAAALAYLGLFGFWDKSMSTIALVATSVLICVVFGAPLGIWCAKSPRVNFVAKPILDVMQTMPAFVYLIPAVAFFSIGKPPGVLATVIFAMPPMNPAHDPRYPAGAGRGEGGGHRLRCDAAAAALQGRVPARDTFDNDRHQPDHHDEPVDGGGGGVDRRGRARL